MNEENKNPVEVQEENAPVEEKEPKLEEIPLPEPEAIEYDTDNLKNIEAAREVFLKQYKVQNIVKWIVSVAALALIIVGWLVFFNISVYLTIGTVGASLLLILLYNFFIKRYSSLTGRITPMSTLKSKARSNPSSLPRIKFTKMSFRSEAAT